MSWKWDPRYPSSFRKASFNPFHPLNPIFWATRTRVEGEAKASRAISLVVISLISSFFSRMKATTARSLLEKSQVSNRSLINISIRS